MLNYKVKLTEPKGYDEISVEELYLSTDLSYISGITRLDSNLVDGQTIMIEFNENGNFIESTVNCKKVTINGYVVYNQEYKVFEHKQGNDGFYCFLHNDGKYYVSFNSGSTINYRGIEYQINTDKMTITIPTIYYIKDKKLKIDDIIYDVDIELYRYPYLVNEDGSMTKIPLENINDYENQNIIYKYEIDEENPPFVTIRGNLMLEVKKCNQEDWYDVIEFIIKKDDDFKLIVDDISCAKRFPYVYYGMDNVRKYNDQETIINGNNVKYYFEKYDKDKGKYYTTINGKQYYLENDRIIITENIDGEEKKTEYIVNYEWRNTINGNVIHLFVDNVNFKFVSNQKILVTSNGMLSTTVYSNSNDEYLYCGSLYNESEDFIDYAQLDSSEHEIFYTNEKWGINGETTQGTDIKYGYIVINGSPIMLTVFGEGENKEYAAPYNNFKGKVKEYKYVEIDNVKYLVNSYERYNYEGSSIVEKESSKYITVNKIERYLLNIDEVISNSMLRCHPIINDGGSSFNVCSVLVANHKKFNFSLVNPLFNDNNVNIDAYISDFLNNGYFDIIKLFNPSGYIEIPMLFGNSMFSNVLKEDIIENHFFKKEKEEAINPIIDMEREIYYPSFNTTSNTKELINEIVFDLHFRSRNLDDWKINEDLYTSLDESQKEKIKTRYNWNLFDYYNWFTDDDNKPKISEDYEKNGFYQPADLLYFLNFTDDDVFYQKSKIGKSFLRLLFFNSDDPLNQSLLYSCTVFMDENKYYKTYIDNMLRIDKEYTSVIELQEDEEPTVSSGYNISSDTSINSAVTFEDETRISASFHIKNRYEMSESSEGFYLYIFKEYCEKLHEEPIYLKVEFNHAGIGRTINFMMPYKIDENGNKSLYDLTNESEYKEFAKGVRLSELHKKLYIPLESVYDEENKRYCYYMPEWMCKNDDRNSVMKFNLYEIKIMDESDEET